MCAVAGGEGRCGGQGRLAAEAAGCRRLSIQVVEGGEKYAEQDLMVCGKHIRSTHYHVLTKEKPEEFYACFQCSLQTCAGSSRD